MRDARNEMAEFAFKQIENAVILFTSLCQYNPKDRRYRRNLDWLEKLRNRASARLTAVSTAKTKEGTHSNLQKQHPATDADGDAVDEFLGWRTRLIERTGQDRPTVSTILSPATPAGSMGTNNTGPSPDAAYSNMIYDHQLGAEMIGPGSFQPWPSNDPMNVAV